MDFDNPLEGKITSTSTLLSRTSTSSESAYPVWSRVLTRGLRYSSLFTRTTTASSRNPSWKSTWSNGIPAPSLGRAFHAWRRTHPSKKEDAANSEAATATPLTITLAVGGGPAAPGASAPPYLG